MRTKFILILFSFCLSFLLDQKAYSLNIFEISLIGIGVGYAYDQYNYKSLSYESNFEKKVNVIEKFIDSKKVNVGSDEIFYAPIHHQLSVIEEIHTLKRHYR